MSNVRPRFFPRWLTFKGAAALVLTLLTLNCLSARAQNVTNVLGWAKASETVMETETNATFMIVRTGGTDGKLQVSVGVKQVATNAVIATNWVPPVVIFSNYQMSATIVVPIVHNFSTNSFPAATLYLTNATVAAGESTNYTPAIASSGTNMSVTAVNVDTPFTVSFGRMNNWTNEGETLHVPVTLNGSLNQGDSIDVTYAIETILASDVAAGADIADIGSDITPAQTQSITFTPNNLTVFIDVLTVADTLVEFDEEFKIHLLKVNGESVVPPPSGSTNAPTTNTITLSSQNWARGRILFNGSSAYPQPAGAVDQFFNPVTTTNRNPGANGPVSVTLRDSLGNCFIGGNFTAVNAQSRVGIAKLDSVGVLDPTFDPPGGANDTVASMKLYNSGPNAGKLLVGGAFTAMNGDQYNHIARLNADGTTDTTFNSALGAGTDGPVYAIDLEADGSIIIGGDFTTVDGVPRRGVARLQADGKLDLNSYQGVDIGGTVFGVALQAAPPLTAVLSDVQTDVTNAVTKSVANLPGKVISVSLNYSNMEFTNRYTLTFGSITQSVVLVNPPMIVTNTDNTLTTNYPPATRTFTLGPAAAGTNTLAIRVAPASANSTSSWAYTAVATLTTGGSVVAVGDFQTVNGQTANGVIRFGGNGAVDPVFLGNIGAAANGAVNAIAAQSDGKLILGGAFPFFNNRRVGGLARLLADGTPDVNFNVGTGANGGVLTVKVDTGNSDGIYVGGEFTAINSTRRIFLARLFKDGPLDTSFMDTAYNQFAGFPDPNGFAPDGFITSLDFVSGGTNIVVGGLFDAVGGGATRASAQSRHNFAAVVSQSTPGPGNIEFSAPLYGVNENDGARIAEIARENGTLGPVSVTAATADAAATADEDYKPQVTPVSFNNGATAPGTDFAVTIIDDTKLEGDEDLLVNLVSLSSGLLLGGEPIPLGVAYAARTQSRIMIFDDDHADAVFAFAKPEFNADENSGFATIEVYRLGSSADRVTVTYAATQGSSTNAATDGVDFNSVTNTLVFSPGQTNRTFQVRILDDVFTEADEVVKLSLSQPRGGAIIDTNAANATLFIVDNDLPSGKIDFATGSYKVTEGQSNIVVEVQRSGGNVGLVSVDYTTVDGTALAGQDYLPVSGTLTWNNQDITTKRITIPIVDNADVEALENFKLILTNGSQASIIGTRHPDTTVLIADNDSFGNISFGTPDFYADENGVNAVIEVVRRDGIADTVSVDYKTTPGTAKTNIDYQDVSGTLTFAPGQTALTFTVPIIDNTNQDGNRTIRLFLTNSVKATLGALTNATLTIIDNESFNIPGGDVQRDFAIGDGANARVSAVLIQNDGPTNSTRKILLAGQFTQFDHVPRTHVARLGDNGALDLSYADGLVIDGDVNAAVLTENGRMVVGGTFANVDGARMNRLARLNSIGRRDTSFDIGSGANGTVLALAETFIQVGTNTLSRIVVGGEFFTFSGQVRNRIALLTDTGAVDSQFNPGAGPDGRVTAVAAQRDGKIVIAGDFSNVGSFVRPRLARLNLDGTADTTFNPGAGLNGPVRAVAIQADDKVLVAGEFTRAGGQPRVRIARFNPDGTLDATFDPGTGADASVYALGLQADGNIVIAGDFLSVNGITRPRIARLLPSGAVDLNINFGTGADKLIAALAIQYDRKIVIGGDFTMVNGFPQNRVARLFGGSLAGSGRIEFTVSDTQVNESAGSAQIIVQRFGGTEGTATATVYTVPETATPGQDYQDVTNTLVFGPGEAYRVITVPIIDDNLAEAPERVLLVLTNVTGAALGRQPVAHLEILSDDALISFESATFRASEISNVVNRVNVGIIRSGDLSGSVSVTVTTQPGTATAGSDYVASTNVVIFTPGESIKTVPIDILDDTIGEGDETFTLNLAVSGTHAFPGIGSATFIIEDNDTAKGIFVFPSTNMVVAEASGTNFVTIRRTSGSQENVSVNVTTTAGTASTNDFIGYTNVINFAPGQTTATFPVIILDDDLVEAPETIIVTLSNPTNGAQLGTPSSMTITIADDDLGPGSIDASFDPGAGAGGTNKTVYSIIVQPDGSIIAGGGFTQFGAYAEPRLVKLLANGSVDTNFSTGVGPSDVVYSLTPADNGRITVGGAFLSFNSTDKLYVARILPGGSLDPSMSQSAGLNGPVRSVAAQPDTKVLIGGDFTVPANRAGRINASGSLDVSFNTGFGADSTVYDSEITVDGKVILGGAFQHVDNVPRNRVARLLGNGLIDPAFNTSVGANATVYRVLPLADRKVLIAGDFTSINGTNQNRLARLNEDGSLDTSFSISNGFNGVIFAMTLEGTNKLLVAGDFTQAEGQPLTRVARLNLNDGTLDPTFNPTLTVDGAIRDIEVQPDGKIVIAGSFTNVNGFARVGIARLNGQPVAKAINITEVALDAGDLVITFDSQAGVSYDIEGTPDFLSWTTVKSVTATGDFTSVTGLPTDQNYKFFRVRRTSP